MEIYIKNNVSDITYQSELIPLHSCRMQEGGLVRTYNLASLTFAKLCAY